MKRDFSSIYGVDYSSDYIAEYDIACDGRGGSTYEDLSMGQNIDVNGAEIDVGHGPIKDLPSDLWNLITTYLLTPDTMALGCTARAAHAHLRPVLDAILSGCRTIDSASRRWERASKSVSEVIDELTSLRLEVRCNMLKRYAKQVGLLNYVVASKKAESKWALRFRYFAKTAFESGTIQARSMHVWQRAVDTARAAVCEKTCDVARRIALCDLYLAEMYAPLLGVVADPEPHVQRVMDAARSNLSMLRWMEFLYELRPVKEIWAPIARAVDSLATDFDRSYPVPKHDALAAMVEDAMTIPHGKPMRDVCRDRFGITPQALAKEMIPRITESVVASFLSRAATSGRSVRSCLMWFIGCWDDVDGAVAASLHQSFLTAIAKDRLPASTSWTTLSEAVRIALRTAVLNIAPHDAERHGLDRCSIIDFWGLYFEVTDRKAILLSIDIESRMDALPWPLQATLWRIAADVHADPHRAVRGHTNPTLHRPSLERVDTLCTLALTGATPQLAIPALQAALKWEVARACASYALASERASLLSYTATSTCVVKHLLCTPAALSVIETCTVAQRLPFVAALADYRELLMTCGYAWTFEALISEDVAALLGDPTFHLIRPSQAVVQVLRRYLPSFGASSPGRLLEGTVWESTLVERLDLPATHTVSAVAWGRETESTL